jgi:thiamine transporter ThiT
VIRRKQLIEGDNFFGSAQSTGRSAATFSIMQKRIFLLDSVILCIIIGLRHGALGRLFRRRWTSMPRARKGDVT